jgi:hypothetical protein
MFPGSTSSIFGFSIQSESYRAPSVPLMRTVAPPCLLDADDETVADLDVVYNEWNVCRTPLLPRSWIFYLTANCLRLRS